MLCLHYIIKFAETFSAAFWTEISAETEISNLAGTGTEISVQTKISAGTGTEPNFGRSLSMRDLEVKSQKSKIMKIWIR